MRYSSVVQRAVAPRARTAMNFDHSGVSIQFARSLDAARTKVIHGAKSRRRNGRIFHAMVQLSSPAGGAPFARYRRKISKEKLQLPFFLFEYVIIRWHLREEHARVKVLNSYSTPVSISYERCVAACESTNEYSITRNNTSSPLLFCSSRRREAKRVERRTSTFSSAPRGVEVITRTFCCHASLDDLHTSYAGIRDD